ncbi:hypothetical protein PHJA_000430700 [Phtheirospermum japonicum]|uniref:Uncharacterized protein n=1 Tax=Phtheirospermum japonicum TaxID=374723 RepID=A0A830B797_9LAMI|nr:hypothetical protein PHJA_000430700 [Phtheirospermum japonicum]
MDGCKYTWGERHGTPHFAATPHLLTCYLKRVDVSWCDDAKTGRRSLLGKNGDSLAGASPAKLDVLSPPPKDDDATPGINLQLQASILANSKFSVGDPFLLKKYLASEKSPITVEKAAAQTACPLAPSTAAGVSSLRCSEEQSVLDVIGFISMTALISEDTRGLKNLFLETAAKGGRSWKIAYGDISLLHGLCVKFIIIPGTQVQIDMLLAFRVIRAPGLNVLKVPLVEPRALANGVSIWDKHGSAFDEGEEAATLFSL